MVTVAGDQGAVRMFKFGKIVAAIAVSASLGACALPRGAALQSEIVKSSEAEEANFAVYAVTKDALPQIGKWPATGGVSQFSWVSKQRGPIGRVILAGDLIQLSVWDSDDNSLLTSPGAKVAALSEVRVATNGTIFVPYAGAVRISGMTDQNARETIQSAIEAVSPSAQVQLVSQVGQRHSVSLVSGVNKPGSIPLVERDMTLLAAISQGGGVSASFKNPQVRLLRGNTTYATPLERLFKNPSLDTTLRSGDKVIVAETEKYFLAQGAAGSEDLITFPKEHVSALDAVSLMGGLSDTRANPQGVLVLREYGPKAVRSDGNKGPSQQRVVFTMDLTSADGLFSAGKFSIMPKDVVYATESPVNNARTILGLLGSTLGIARVLN